MKIFLIAFLIAFPIVNLLYAFRERVARFVEDHIICEGWEDSEGFHKGKQP